MIYRERSSSANRMAKRILALNTANSATNKVFEATKPGQRIITKTKSAINEDGNRYFCCDADFEGGEEVAGP